jgi:UDPglucose 6-dehydrogenase
MRASREPIAVIGTGYVGLVTAAGFAELGSDVFCVDVDAGKVAALEEGRMPIYEPGLEDAVGAHRDRLHFSTDLGPALEGARLLFVCVDTPSTYSGDADLSSVQAVVNAMPASDRHALVMKSTVPPGTGATIKRELASQGKGLAYVACPEFLREGSALADFRSPDRIVIGDDRDWAGDAVVELYSVFDAPIVRTDIVSAEMVKLASNAFLSTKISFINEIANVCEETGADVIEVARGMGLDARIGQSFLQAGIGFGGSCLAGDETVLVRHRGHTRLMRFDALYDEFAAEGLEDEETEGLIEPTDLEVLSWLPEHAHPQFLPVAALTRRRFDGQLLEVRTKMGRRIRCTPDHPLVVRSPDESGDLAVRLARQLTTQDWLPLAQGRVQPAFISQAKIPVLGALSHVRPNRILLRPPRDVLASIARRPSSKATAGIERSVVAPARLRQIAGRGILRLSEAALQDVPVREAAVATGRDNFAPPWFVGNRRFWRVLGLYLAEGCIHFDGDGPKGLVWTFHATKEQHLVDELLSFWAQQGVAAQVNRTSTAIAVRLWSRPIATWWIDYLEPGRTSYDQRLPDLIWDQPTENKRAVLSGLWEGDGSWSFVNGGPSVVLERGTVSRELADGVSRLLGDLGVVASIRVGRTAKSTRDTYWLRIAGADQIESCLGLVPVADREAVTASLARQQRRISPAGYRRRDDGTVWLRVTGVGSEPWTGYVYSMEVPGAHTFVASHGLICENCFPKDVNALKQVAGNTGYHFQVLGAVIEVNELQKRRVVAKLQKHLGELVGKCVTLLGLAFKPNTDDMREASSLVLAGRLHAEGAEVRAYDPVAEVHARELMPGVKFAPSALDALEGTDACVLVTEWPQFLELDWNEAARRMSGKLVVDGRNALDPEAVKAAGLIYEGIGRR